MCDNSGASECRTQQTQQVLTAPCVLGLLHFPFLSLLLCPPFGYCGLKKDTFPLRGRLCHFVVLQCCQQHFYSPLHTTLKKKKFISHHPPQHQQTPACLLACLLASNTDNSNTDSHVFLHKWPQRGPRRLWFVWTRLVAVLYVCLCDFGALLGALSSQLRISLVLSRWLQACASVDPVSSLVAGCSSGPLSRRFNGVYVCGGFVFFFHPPNRLFLPPLPPHSHKFTLAFACLFGAFL